MPYKRKSVQYVSERMLKPYTIPDECPYLSEEQRELSRLTLEQRKHWMTEWLEIALSMPEHDENDAFPV